MIISLFSTANMRGGRPEELRRMLDSLIEARQAGVELRLLILLQNCEPGAADLGEGVTDFTEVMTAPTQISLSKARNMLLARARELGWLAGDGIVAFPDDDCWYPAGLLRHVSDAFAGRPRLDFWFCRYCANPSPVDPALEAPASLADVLLRASSNTMIFRSQVVAAVGDFDPELGVGTPAKGGEDIDYVLRAHAASRETTYLPQEAIGHRDPNKALRAKYYPAVIGVTARHAAGMPGLRVQLARKVAVGAVMLMQRQIDVYDYLGALRRAKSEWRNKGSGASK